MNNIFAAVGGFLVGRYIHILALFLAPVTLFSIWLASGEQYAWALHFATWSLEIGGMLVGAFAILMLWAVVLRTLCDFVAGLFSRFAEFVSDFIAQM